MKIQFVSLRSKPLDAEDLANAASGFHEVHGVQYGLGGGVVKCLCGMNGYAILRQDMAYATCDGCVKVLERE